MPHPAHPALLVPTLMFSFEDNLNEATGLVTMVTGGNPGLGQQQTAVTYTDSDTPATLGRAVVSDTDRRCWASNDSPVELALGSAPFTFEGVCRINTGQVGGIVMTKNWYDSEPSTFYSDWSIEVSTTAMRFSWQRSDFASPITVSYTASSPPLDRDFNWAVTDDGLALKFYRDGALILTTDSVRAQPFPPHATSTSRLMLFGGLAGFYGPTPNLGGTGFTGRVALFRYYKGVDKYARTPFPATFTDPAVA